MGQELVQPWSIVGERESPIEIILKQCEGPDVAQMFNGWVSCKSILM